MTTTTTQTDRMAALAAEEFLWDVEGPVEAHRFLLGPIVDRLQKCSAADVLDLGCGNGALTAALRERGFRMTGMDHSQSGIEIARRRHTGIRFERFDVTEPLPQGLEGRFDAVVAAEVIEHLLLPRKLLERAREALRPGGSLIVTTPFHGYWKNLALALTGRFDDHWHPLRDFGHVKFFSRRTLSMLFEELGYQDLSFVTTGRIPMLARSMILSGRKPQ